MWRRGIYAAVPLVALVLALTPCCKGEETKPLPKKDATGGTAGGGPAKQDASSSTATPRPEGPTGTIKGSVKFTGTAPERVPIQNASDPFCARTQPLTETVIANDNGTLRDVVVRVAPGQVKGWVPAEPVKVNQVGCVYRPRVQTAVVNQFLEVTNSDETGHNVHGRARKLEARQAVGDLFNKGQPSTKVNAKPLRRQISEQVDVYELRCDLHAWMRAYVVLSDNPYADVSGETGEFTIEQAPVGTYKLQTWHAFYGVKEAEVTVEEGKTAVIEFTYDAEADKPPGG